MKKTLHRAQRQVTGPLFLFGLMVLVEPPAEAGLQGLELIEESTPSDTTALKQLIVECPAGKVAISGGVGTSTNEVRLLQSTPDGDLPTGWLGLASELSAGNPWSLTVGVWCADPPPGFERVGALSTTGPASSKTAIAFCPSGKEVLGVGGQVFLSFEDKGLGSMALDVGSQSVLVFASQVSGNQSWGVRADVLCADQGTLSSAATLRSGAGGIGSPSGSLYTECPQGSAALVAGPIVFVSGAQVPTWLNRSLPTGSTGSRWNMSTVVLDTSTSVAIQTDLICVSASIFADGFESGDTTRWSVSADL